MSSSSGKDRIYIITIAVCILMCLVFFVFAYVQKAGTDAAKQDADKNAILARECQEIADQNAMEAVKIMDKLKKAEQTIREKDSIIAVLKKRK